MIAFPWQLAVAPRVALPRLAYLCTMHAFEEFDHSF